MTYTVCYWNPETARQEERDCTPAEVAEIEARKAAALLPVVPESVSPRQIRQALTALGLRSAVEAAVAAGDQNLKDWWEFATAFERAHPRVIAMAQALDVSTEELDQLFIVAAGL